MGGNYMEKDTFFLKIITIGAKSLTWVCLFLLVPFTSAADDCLKPIDIAIGEWKPYVSQELEGYGEVTQKITLILERMGYRPNYIFMPWGQAEMLVRKNAENYGPRGTFPFRQLGDRVKYFYFSEEPILQAHLVFFYNKEKIETGSKEKAVLKKPKDLEKYKLGYIKKSAGYEYPEELQKIFDKHGTAVDNDYLLFKRLIDNNDMNIQVVPELKEVGLDLLYNSFSGEQEKIKLFKKDITGVQDYFLTVESFFLTSLLNPENKEFMDKFNKQHKALIDLGILEQISQKAKQQPSLRKPAVILTSESSVGYIKTIIKDKVYLLPKGTKGLLLDWIPNDKNDAVKAKIYILSYPYRGLEVTVDGRYVELQ
jgi:polar amino acid transport system substrate-binding protein